MSKIITVTFHCAHNYGAVLQAYALQKYISDNYELFETACLDYRPGFLMPKLIVKIPHEGLLLTFIHNIITFRSRYLRKQKFDKFIKKYIKTVQPSQELDSKNNIFIVGSDQVWNKDITNHQLNDVYFLKMIKNAKKTSYAASIGNTDRKAHEQVANEIRDFDKIGVREKYSQILLEQNGISNVQVNIDPVFLLDKQDYEKLSVKLINLNCEYVLVYTLETNIEIEEKVRELKNKYKIISIGSFRNIYKTDIHFSSISPEEYLGLIRDAKYIISNSFHAIAFSIIFEKKFEYVPLRNNRGIRIDNLLSILHAKENVCDVSIDRKKLLEPYINISKRWIKEIVEGTSCEEK